MAGQGNEKEWALEEISHILEHNAGREEALKMIVGKMIMVGENPKTIFELDGETLWLFYLLVLEYADELRDTEELKKIILN